VGEPSEAMREEGARLVWDFLQRVSHDPRVPSDLADEAEELRGAMEELNFWEMEDLMIGRTAKRQEAAPAAQRDGDA
jgi:hypothetical protein